jgi:transcriptional regulator with XRE-family HTH domain
MAIQERLKMIIKMHNLNASAFADKIGVQRSNVSHILGGRNKPSIDFLEKTLTHFPRVNAMWLITGKTQEIKQTNSEALDSNSTNQNKATEVKDESVETQVVSSKKEIEKIVVFYSDKTFDIHLPNAL